MRLKRIAESAKVKALRGEEKVACDAKRLVISQKQNLKHTTKKPRRKEQLKMQD